MRSFIGLMMRQAKTWNKHYHFRTTQSLAVSCTFDVRKGNVAYVKFIHVKRNPMFVWRHHFPMSKH